MIEGFDGLLVDYVRKKRAIGIIRGLRAVSDFEYEMQMALMNRRLDNTIETVFLMPSEEYSFITSTIVKEAASYGGDVSSLVPKVVVQKLRKKLREVVICSSLLSGLCTQTRNMNLPAIVRENYSLSVFAFQGFL